MEPSFLYPDAPCGRYCKSRRRWWRSPLSSPGSRIDRSRAAASGHAGRMLASNECYMVRWRLIVHKDASTSSHWISRAGDSGANKEHAQGHHTRGLRQDIDLQIMTLGAGTEFLCSDTISDAAQETAEREVYAVAWDEGLVKESGNGKQGHGAHNTRVHGQGLHRKGATRRRCMPHKKGGEGPGHEKTSWIGTTRPRNGGDKRSGLVMKEVAPAQTTRR